MSQIAAEYRVQYGIKDARNIAVVEYRDSTGALRRAVAESDFEANLHSEKIIDLNIKDMGIDKSQVTRIYTERQPCVMDGHNCTQLINENYGNAQISYSFDFGADKASAYVAKKDLLSAVKALFK